MEHLFHVMKRQFGFAQVRYRGLAKNTHHLLVSCALINLVQSKAHLVSRDQLGLTLRSLLLVLVALGLSVWGGYRLYYGFIGDADYRIHIYNSYRAQTVSIAIKRIGEKTEEVVLKEANVKPGKGISFWAIHAGEHVIDILYPVHNPTKTLSVEVPPRDQVLDVLVELGGHGEFHVFPLFRSSGDILPEQRGKELARLKEVYKEYVNGG